MRLSIFDPHRWGESALANLAGRVAAPSWFTPADPLVLAVQRIAAGLVLIYVVAVSTPLLPILYAPDGLIDQQTANVFRLEAPITLPSEGWDPPEGSLPPLTGEEAEKAKQGFLPRDRMPPILRPERENKRDPANDPYYLRWGIGPQFVYEEGTLQFSPYFHLKDRDWIPFVHGCGLIVAVHSSPCSASARASRASSPGSTPCR